MKKFFAILVSILMVFSLAVTAAAADANGSITIENAVEGHTYSVYKMAVLESQSGTAYSYKCVDAWEDFFTAKPDYFTLDNGYVILQKQLTDDEKVQLAKDALAYAKDKNIGATDEYTVAEGETTASFTGLELGYYLIDSTVGTFCGLTTTNKETKIQAKNAAPSVEKEVEEDSTGEYGETNDADFYQTVNFKTTITVQKGAENYVLHDKMSAGLTFGSIESVQVDGVDVAAGNYEIITAPAEGAEDQRTHNDCTFEIVFDNDYIAALKAGTTIVVSYTASLNENAVIAGEGNPNETWLDYGDTTSTDKTYSTPVDETVTYVYEFDVVKTDSDKTLLDGAEFKLYDAETGGNEIKLVKEADGSYRVAKEGETGEVIVVTGGKVTITGLDGGTRYWLEETKAPQGYNLLNGRTEVQIVDANLSATVDGTTYTQGGVQVVNKTGSELPSTGGLGTTLFTIIGSVLVIGAGILLVTKKRMSKIEA